MNLGGTKSKKKPKKAQPSVSEPSVVQEVDTSVNSKKKKATLSFSERKPKQKAKKPSSKSKKEATLPESSDGVEILASEISLKEQEGDKVENKTTDVVSIEPFEYGLIHPSLQSAIPENWNREPELDLFAIWLRSDKAGGSCFVADITERSSFVRNGGGVVF